MCELAVTSNCLIFLFVTGLFNDTKADDEVLHGTGISEL
jgi:hypothetical protein